ncbi:hypothetical protein JCM15519_29210 [Fundidesulfovibrio butyratiphilus]
MRNPLYAAAGALTLAALLATAGAFVTPARAQQTSGPLPVPTAAPAAHRGGNRALMEDWARQKRLVRDQAHLALKRLNALPRTGQVLVEATLLPDPKHPGQTVVRIDSLQVRDTSTPGVDAPAREVLPPTGPDSGKDTSGEGRRVNETFSIVDGQLRAKP